MPYLETLLEEVEIFSIFIAKKAGRILRRRYGKDIQISHKGEINLVTDVDLASEKMIKESIKAKFKNHAIVAEESFSENVDSPFCWFVDPLDGTTNYAHTYPFFAVSIAFSVEGEILFGVVYDPFRDELFYAKKGCGAFLGDKKISVSEQNLLSKSLLCTGFPYDLREDENNNLDHFKNFIYRALAIRRDGSAALDLCYVACGRFDGFWELKLYPWDMAAGVLIVEEAGGKVTDFSGGPFSVWKREVVASNSKIHEEMLYVLSLK